MNFSIANYSSEEITPFSAMIEKTSEEIRGFLKKKSYGNQVQELYVGFICVNPAFDQFFAPRRKYTKSTKMLEYDIKDNFEIFKDLNEDQARYRLLMGMLDTIDDTLKKLNLDNFDVDAYKNDLTDFFKKKKWMN